MRKKELWLEFGFLMDNNYHDMCWYNEGRMTEIPYFLKALWFHRSNKNMYFFWRYGGKKHYLKGRHKKEKKR